MVEEGQSSGIVNPGRSRLCRGRERGRKESFPAISSLRGCTSSEDVIVLAFDSERRTCFGNALARSSCKWELDTRWLYLMVSSSLLFIDGSLAKATVSCKGELRVMYCQRNYRFLKPS